MWCFFDSSTGRFQLHFEAIFAEKKSCGQQKKDDSFRQGGPLPVLTKVTQLLAFFFPSQLALAQEISQKKGTGELPKKDASQKMQTVE